MSRSAFSIRAAVRRLAIGAAAALAVTYPGVTAQAQLPPGLSPIVFHDQTAQIPPDPSVLTNGTGASDALAGTLGWRFDLTNQSQGPVTNPAITVNSGWGASHFPGLTSPAQDCPAISRSGSAFPFTWTESTLPGQPGGPGPCGPSNQMDVRDMSFSDLPVVFSSGFDSSRTVDTTVIPPGGSQTVTVRVTTRATMYGTAPAQVFVNVTPPGFFSGGQVVTSTSDPSGVGPCPQPDFGGATPCLQQQSAGPGQAFWILNHPALGVEYDFGAVLTRVDPGSTPVRSLPDVRVTGIPHASPPDVVYPESSGTSATITDSSLDGPSAGSGTIDFRVDQTVTWGVFPAVQLLQHDFIVQYNALFPTPLGSYPSTGTFVISDGNAAAGDHVNFWGSQWTQNNSLSGGPAPGAFKGFERSSQPPGCGGSWTAAPGDSGSPPATVPGDMIVIVASSVTQAGGTISGKLVHLVVVKTDPGYQPGPGHPGTGQVEAIIC